MHIIQKINYGNIIDPLSLKWLSEQTTTCYGQFASNRSVYTSNYLGKGQIISKQNFGILNFPRKKMTDFYPII